jgi:hypothetical protein
MATVETEMARIRAADAPAAARVADAPVTQAPAVTDDTPATVIADGTGRTAVTAAPERAAPPPDAPLAEASPAPVESAPVAAVATDIPGDLARFSFERESLSVREGDVAARVVIRRSGNPSGTADVTWRTADATAVADRDYADLGARAERFAPGESSRTIYVPLTNDSVPEPTRSFRVLLDGGAEIRVDIVDDD